MSKSLLDLIQQMSPSLIQRDLNELPLLTLGSQFQGGNNNSIGKLATKEIFMRVAEIVHRHISERSETALQVTNASKRRVSISLGSDPDISIVEEFGEEKRKKVAIEIKGGSDRSNAHNRAGEAEKSHQKARNQGFRDFWTLIAKKGLDLKKLRAESPTTTSWFDVSQVLAREGEDWLDFESRFAGEVGIPLKKRR